jgi:SNF2 family DNA or RNA helicase
MVEQQAIGRALRLGQTKKVVVSRYIMRGTIEEVCSVSCTR